jgi:uncharacterized surface protein with fasciclin (FAS1) repeats
MTRKHSRRRALAVLAAAAAVSQVLTPAVRADVSTAVQKNPRLTTLAGLLRLSDFAQRVKEAGGGPVTVFAPSDEAFNKLPASVREQLASDGGRALLNIILSYHVVPGALSAADLAGYPQNGKPATLAPLGGGTLLTVAGSGTDLTINGAKIVTPNAFSDRTGTVHIIDTVLIPQPLVARLGNGAGSTSTAGASATPPAPTTPTPATPPAPTATTTPAAAPPPAPAAAPAGNPATPTPGTQNPGTVVSVSQGEPEFSTLTRLIGAAGLVEDLSKPGPFTLLAPTNAAFEKLPAGTLDDLLKPENKARLVAVLQNHVLVGRLGAADAANLSQGGRPADARTLGGGTVRVTAQGPALSFGAAKVTKPDVKASNGVIHQIDAVLLPAAPASTP